MSSTRIRTTVSAAAALLLSLPLGAQERHVLTGASAVIWNLAGEVRVERGSGNDVVVEVTRGGADGRRLEIAASGGQLRIRYPDDDIVYRGGRDGRSSTSVHVRSDGTFKGEWGSGGRRVEVNLAVGSVEATDVEGEMRFDVHAASVRATGTKGRLVIDAGSGSVRVENASGELEVDTGSGSTTLSSLKMSRVMVDAGSGSVNAHDVEAERFSVDVGSGSITIDALATDDLYVDTGSGSVRIELVKVPRRSEIDTGSGSVSLVLPAGLNADLDISTGSGGISSDFPVTMEQMRRRELRGRIGEGGPVIRVSTGSGGVRLVKR